MKQYLDDADHNLIDLAGLLDECSDELSPGGDGCSRCSCTRACFKLWSNVKPARDNHLSVKEYYKYAEQFEKLKGRRQLIMVELVTS